MNALQIFEYILTEGDISSTYKYALLSSILDYVIENPLEKPQNNFHFVPIFYLARQFLGYYHPLVLEGIRQGYSSHSETGIAIEGIITNFIKKVSDKSYYSFSLQEPKNTFFLYSSIENQELSKEVLYLLHEIRQIVLDQPIRFVNNVKGEKLSLFGVFTKGISFQYSSEEHIDAGLRLYKRHIKDIKLWPELLEQDKCRVFIGHQTYQELSRFRFLLRDVVLKRWAQVSNEKMNCGDPTLLSKFDLWKSPQERETHLTSKYKQLYREIGLNNCVYCGKKISGSNYHLDHLIPWSRLPVNRFWNLYPACQSCNLEKSDKIPLLSDDLTERLKVHLKACMAVLDHEQKLVLRDLENLYYNRFNSSLNEKDDFNRVDEVVEYLKNLSMELLEVIPNYSYHPDLIERKT